MKPITFLILSLSTWRLSSLLVDESGPFDIFDHVRARAGVAYDSNNRQLPYYQQSTLAQLFTCVWCMSVWVGLALSAAYRLAPRVTMAVCRPLALSAAAIALSRQKRDG